MGRLEGAATVVRRRTLSAVHVPFCLRGKTRGFGEQLGVLLPFPTDSGLEERARSSAASFLLSHVLEGKDGGKQNSC